MEHELRVNSDGNISNSRSDFRRNKNLVFRPFRASPQIVFYPRPSDWVDLLRPFRAACHLKLQNAKP